MRKIFICSPFSCQTEKEKANYTALVKDLCKLAIEEQSAPFAPHLLYPQFLDDNNSLERSLGILSGISFLHACDELWYSEKYGISAGMRKEMEEAKRWGLKIVKK